MTENENMQNAENMPTEAAAATTPVAAEAPHAAAVTGAPVPPPQPQQAYQMPPQQQQVYAQPQSHQKMRTQGFGSVKKEKWPAVILAFALGMFGVHKFYLGYKNEGLAMLLIAIIGSICFGLGATVMMIFGFIEAVKYISLTEEDFEATYIRGYKGWF